MIDNFEDKVVKDKIKKLTYSITIKNKLWHFYQKTS